MKTFLHSGWAKGKTFDYNNGLKEISGDSKKTNKSYTEHKLLSNKITIYGSDTKWAKAK